MSEIEAQAFGVYDMADPYAARLVERIVGALQRCGEMTTGRLAGFVHLGVQDKRFQNALNATVAAGLVVVKPRPMGIAHVASLVSSTGWGSEINSEFEAKRQEA